MAQLSRARDRSMHSIVATIQAEQDQAIRAPGQGRRRRSAAAPAPARRSWRCTARRTCSTPTGAATRPAACWSSGPRGVFMRYIERVLPSLGETAVALRSLGEVVDGLRATRHDEPAVADGQGLGADGRADASYGAPAGARVARGVPGLLARRRDRARPRRARQAAAPADVAGPPQPAAAAGRLVAARRDVAPGARRARPRAGPRGLRRRHARPRRRSSTSRCRGGRRSTRPRCSAGCATRSSWPGWPRACVTPEEQRLLVEVVGRPTTLSVEDVPADRRAALRPRRRPRPRARTTTSSTTSLPRAASTCRS